MTTNVLTAMINISNHASGDLSEVLTGNNRANLRGDALEVYVRDAFCNSFDITSPTEKRQRHDEFFSYISKASNPPDFMITAGDAIEVKKIESQAKKLHLNSSSPKRKLFKDDNKISAECRNAEGGNWNEKSLIYSIGFVQVNVLKELFFVDGACYIADKQVYDNIFNRAKSAIAAGFDDDELGQTVEIGRINKIDALESSYLRVRPMWTLKHPKTVFSNYIHINSNSRLNVVTILPKNKFESYDNVEEFNNIIVNDERYSIENIYVPNPNNLEEEMEVIVIHLAV